MLLVSHNHSVSWRTFITRRLLLPQLSQIDFSVLVPQVKFCLCWLLITIIIFFVSIYTNVSVFPYSTYHSLLPSHCLQTEVGEASLQDDHSNSRTNMSLAIFVIAWQTFNIFDYLMTLEISQWSFHTDLVLVAESCSLATLRWKIDSRFWTHMTLLRILDATFTD